MLLLDDVSGPVPTAGFWIGESQPVPLVRSRAEGRWLRGCLLSVVEADGRVERDPSESHGPALRQD